MAFDNTTHPYMVSVWVTPTSEGKTFFDRPYWMEMARCQSEMRAGEVADCLALRNRLVQVAKLQGDRFVAVRLLPDEATVKRETGGAMAGPDRRYHGA
ncbi:MAG TPA: hypothetical protein VNE61_08660 [Ktedonobacteraceae bacterium]|nr:hypothetical protein [Ktedonobacteraceae bacterium]